MGSLFWWIDILRRCKIFTYSGYINFQSRIIRCLILLYSWSRTLCIKFCHFSKINKNLWHSHCLWFQRSWLFQKNLKSLRFLNWYSGSINRWSTKSDDVKIPIKKYCHNWTLHGRFCGMSTCWFIDKYKKRQKNRWLCDYWCCWRNCNLSLTFYEPSNKR